MKGLFIYLTLFLALPILYGFYRMLVMYRLDNYITFYDVGQGDGAVLYLKGSVIMFDVGRNYQLDASYARSIMSPICRIDIIFITHLDRDHYGGLSRILEHCKVKKVVLSQSSYNNVENKDIIKQVSRSFNLGTVVPVSSGDRIYYEGVEFIVLSPDNRSFSTENERSLVVYFEVNDSEVLITGDSESYQLDAIVDDIMYINSTQTDYKVILYKVSHHGSKYNHSELLIDNYKPDLCIISVGTNSYGHPDKKVISSLERKKCNVLRTDSIGDVTIAL